MLRLLFSQPKRIDAGQLHETMLAIGQYRRMVKAVPKPAAGKGSGKPYSPQKLELHIHGFERALDELEQSKFACESFGARIGKRYLEQLNESEYDHYRRHVYFYKNAFVRVFSVLDKLGFILNQVLDLHTEKIKSRYSYFTVLRQMQEKNIQPELARILADLKSKHQDALNRLRYQRNMEIHSINAEMVDDVKHAGEPNTDGLTPIENIQDNMRDLASCYEMVCGTLLASFRYLQRKRIW